MAFVKKNPIEGDPLIGFQYEVAIDGLANTYFTEVSGLGSESEVIDHKVVGPNGTEAIRKIPGRLKWGDITLKRGLTANMELWEWRAEVVEGKLDKARRGGTIKMLDRNHTPIAEWTFVAGWPSNLSGPTLGADANEVAVEELTIVHEGIKRKT